MGKNRVGVYMSRFGLLQCVSVYPGGLGQKIVTFRLMDMEETVDAEILKAISKLEEFDSDSRNFKIVVPVDRDVRQEAVKLAMSIVEVTGVWFPEIYSPEQCMPMEADDSRQHFTAMRIVDIVHNFSLSANLPAEPEISNVRSYMALLEKHGITSGLFKGGLNNEEYLLYKPEV